MSHNEYKSPRQDLKRFGTGQEGQGTSLSLVFNAICEEEEGAVILIIDGSECRGTRGSRGFLSQSKEVLAQAGHCGKGDQVLTLWLPFG